MSVPAGLSFFDWLSVATPVFLGAAGLLAYYFREKLKQILARSLSRELEGLKAQYQRDLNEQTARHERELEAYRVSLIAETERVRASQSVKTSLALKVAERRFVALTNLLEAHAGLDTAIAGLTIIPQQDANDTAATEVWIRQRSDHSERWNRFVAATGFAKPFISRDLEFLCIEIRKLEVSLMGRRSRPSEPALDTNDADILQLFAKSSELEGKLRELIEELERF